MSKVIGHLSAALAARKWAVLGSLFALLVIADYLGPQLAAIVDQRAGDVLLELNAKRRPLSDRVVIVDIDQRSLEEMNELAGSWPWPRSVHGELIDFIAPQRPKAIVFDVLFNEPDVYRPEHDTAFADAVARQDNVWLAMLLTSDGRGARVTDMPAAVGARALTQFSAQSRVPLLLPLVLLPHPETMKGGLINFTVDADRIGRRYDLYRDRAGWRFASLPARVVGSLGRTLPQKQSILLNWRRGWRHVAYADVYLDSLRQHPTSDPALFRDKIVVVGTSAPGLQDLRPTPLGSTYPGVEMLATAIDNLDRGDWLREVPRGATMPLALVLVVVVAVAFHRRVGAGHVGYAMLCVTVAGLATAWLALMRDHFLPVFAPLAFGWAAYLGHSALAYLQERAQRLRTAAMFQRFLDPRVVTQLIERGDIDHRASAQSREVTVLFSDIRGFTSLSEGAPPEEVVALLNAYFSRQVEVIFRHGGTLDKFIGDAIMAFWGAPAATPDHAARAVAAALEMSQALDAMRTELGALGTRLEIGIGIHTGPAVIGFIGSDARLDYTVIGDTVNLSSRIEGLTKGIGRILVSAATREAAGEAFDWRDRERHSVKGRENQVQLFEPRKKL